MRIRQSCTTTCQTAYQFNIHVHLGKGIDVIVTSDSEIGTDIAPCNRKEADTRLILHALHCAKQSHLRISIRSVNTDIVVRSIATFHALSIGEIWIALGSRSTIDILQYTRLQKITWAKNSRALSFSHALTGCDTTSSFSNVGKKTAWDTWKAFSEITDTVIDLDIMPLS